MFGTIQVRLSVSDSIRDYLTFQCQQSNNLINCVLFEIRQSHFETCEQTEFFDRQGMFRQGWKLKYVKASYLCLAKQFKDNPHYKALGGQCAQQRIMSVVSSFSSYNGLLKLFWKGEIKRPNMPNYRTKGGLAPLTYPAQAVQFDLETGMCRLPVSNELGNEVKEILGKKEVWINGCAGIQPDQISEVRILPKHGELYAEYVYRHGNDGATCHLGLDPNQALGIDPGLDNWLTCVSTRGKSFIVDGKKVKSINQNYNRRVERLKTGKPSGYWDGELARITSKRNRQIRDAINKGARFVVNHCIENNIGVVVFGWGQGIKDGIELGKKNNQEFVQIPTARLKKRIQELCEEIGIQFVETEESYTSKASFLDDDFLPTFGEKPERWKPSGKRVKRGMYKTAKGEFINADCNGAANVLRKVRIQLGLSEVEVLAKVCRAALTLPKRYDVFSGLSKSYRNECEAVLFERTA